MNFAGRRYGMGWIPDYPDFRDYTEETLEVKNLLGEGKKGKKIPENVDLRPW